jgi:hypothetical protein
MAKKLAAINPQQNGALKEGQSGLLHLMLMLMLSAVAL